MRNFLTKLLEYGLLFATVVVNMVVAGIVTFMYLCVALIIQWWQKHISG